MNFETDLNCLARCFQPDSNLTIVCPGRQCALYLIEYSGHSEKKQDCAIENVDALGQLAFFFQYDLQKSIGVTASRLYCQLNGCNSDQSYERTRKLAEQWYDGIAPMRSIIGFLEEEDTTRATSTTTAASSTKHVDRTTTKNETYPITPKSDGQNLRSLKTTVYCVVMALNLRWTLTDMFHQ